MFDFSDINFADKLIGIIIAILQALLISGLTGFLLNRSFRKERNLGKNLNRHGITEIKSQKGGTMSESDHDIVFGLNGKPIPTELDLCFLTGYNFFNDFEHKAHYISRLVANGCKVRILIANPNKSPFAKYTVDQTLTEENINMRTEYYFELLTNNNTDGSFLERSFAMLIYVNVSDDLSKLRFATNDEEKHRIADKIKQTIKDIIVESGDHFTNAIFAENVIAEANKNSANGGKAEIRFFTDEYQMPVIYCKTTEKGKHVNYLWTNLNAPIRETTQSISVSAKTLPDDDNGKNFVNDVETSFNYLWKMYE